MAMLTIIKHAIWLSPFPLMIYAMYGFAHL